MRKHPAITAIFSLALLLLSGCYQVQIKGPVAGADIAIRELREDAVLQQKTSWDVPFLEELFTAEQWEALNDFARLAFVGVVQADQQQFDDEQYYLLTASGGQDLDADQDQVTDIAGTDVLSSWHAIALGSDLRLNGAKVSVLTEIVYQYLSPSLSTLSDVDLQLQLALLAERLVTDVNGDGDIGYRDLLEWSQLFDRGKIQADIALLSEFEDALLFGATAAELRELALAVVESGTERSGEFVYRFSQDSGNSFTCATCHAIVEPSRNGFRRPGHPLGSATHRASYKNGQLSHMLDAVNSCLDEWMNAPAWSESSSDWLALSAWLEQRAAPGEAALVDIQLVSPPADLSGGDANAGRSTFNESCANCHAIDGTGGIQAPPVVGFGLAPELIAQRVRSSGRTDSAVYDGLSGGVMPFWGRNRLSDSELLDIVAYVQLGEDANEDTSSGDEGGGSDSGCPADHPDVGQTARLITRAHGVTGTATVIDNCTIELTEFNYDGRGIVVQAYTGVGKRFSGPSGVAISPDLVGPTYSNATLTFTLPDTITLDQFNSISIWCVEVGVSFGDGVFQ